MVPADAIATLATRERVRQACRTIGPGSTETRTTVSDVASIVWPYGDVEASLTRPYRETLGLLVRYDGPRCRWRVAAGGAILLLLGVLSIAGVIGGSYLAANLHRPLLAVLGAVIVLAVPAVDSYIWRREPWVRLVTDRLATYERNDGGTDLNAIVRPEDFVAANDALRRAKLYPEGGTHIPHGPRLTRSTSP